MADVNQSAQELAEVMKQVNEELRLYGRVHSQTQEELKDVQMKAKYGVENFSKGTKTAADAVAQLAAAGMSAGKAMLDGKKGASAFNESLDGMAKSAQLAGMALALLVPGGPLIKMLVAGMTAAATAAIKYAQAANEMADKIHTGYKGLQKAGGAAADGMSGVYRDAKKLGLSMNELDQMVSIVAESSKDFALFAGSVSQGRKQFADLGAAMKPARTGLMNLGMDMQEINESTASYLRLQSRIGQTQNKTTAELAEGAKRYLYEQDALTKLTGLTRKEQEAAREEIRSQERFAAVLQQMRAQGRDKEAKQLEDSYLMLRSQSKEAAQGFADISTGNLQTEAAQKSMLATQGESMRQAQLIRDGQATAAQGAQQVAAAYGRTAEGLGQLGIVGQFDKTFGSLSDSIKLGAFAQQDINKQYEKILEDQKKQAAGADAMTAQQTALVQKQMEANAAMEAFIKEGILPSQRAMMKLADATNAAAGFLEDVASGAKLSTREAAQDSKNWEKMGALEKVESGLGRGIEALVGLFSTGAQTHMARARMENEEKYLKEKGRYQQVDTKDIPKAADGGLLSGPKEGYLAMLHGTELVIPEGNLGGTIETALSGVNAENSQIKDEMVKLAKEMLKDNQELTKLTDKDLKRQQDYSRISDRLLSLKHTLMEDEISLMEEQNNALKEVEELYTKLMGAEKAKEMTRAFKMQRMGLGSMPGAGGAGGGAGGMPSAAGGPGMSMGGGGPSVPPGPEAHAVGSGGGAQAGKPELSRISSKSGPSAMVNKEYAPRFQQLIDWLDGVGYKIYSLGGYVDRDVRGQPGKKSVHAHGAAIDINPATNPFGSQRVTDMPEEVGQVAAQLGLGWGANWSSIKDAMHFSMAKNEGGTVKLSDGGVATGPNSGYPATLHGEEAVIPLNNNGGNFIKMFESMAESNAKMAAMMEEMVRAQKNSVDVQTKMLRAQS